MVFGMRRRIILIVLAAVALAGCGSSSSSSPANPAAAELSYFPSGSPFVITIATDPAGAPIQGVQALLGRFPFAALGDVYVMALVASLQLAAQTQLHT